MNILTVRAREAPRFVHMKLETFLPFRCQARMLRFKGVEESPSNLLLPSPQHTLE